MHFAGKRSRGRLCHSAEMDRLSSDSRRPAAVSDESGESLLMRAFTRMLTVLLLALWDAASVAASIIIAFGLKYGFANRRLTLGYYAARKEFILLSVVILLLCNIVCRTYRNVWRRAGVADYLRQMVAVLLSTGILLMIDGIFHTFVPPEIIVILACLELILTLGVRVSIEMFYWLHSRAITIRRRKRMTRVLIYGAGEAGAYLVRKLEANPEDNLLPVAFIDDDESLWGKKISGLSVVGGRSRLAQTIREDNIGEVIVAISRLGRDSLKGVLACCRSMHCVLKQFGGIDDVSVRSLSAARISDIHLEDLLRRDSVRLNMRVVKGFIEHKTILVTGGAGSIGSEICRQVLSFGAKKLLVFDIFENGLYEIENELKERFDPDRFQMILGSIRDYDRVREVMECYRPDVVFHAAAHKHVPMMELNPKEALKNNVFGTIHVARAAMESGCEKFILISTDKAVNPANIMGASKRIAEIVIQLYDRLGKTDFAAVRFGNVLGSSGSVVPFFKKQIARGGPVTVTHPQMRRYFMTIPEAVQLVLEAGAMARGGEIFVLDMGEPVPIYELACDLIRLSGYEPGRDIRIEFTGLRPGEKLFEEISLAEEDVTKTPNNKIYICRPMEYDEEHVHRVLEQMDERIRECDPAGVFRCVRELVPTFQSEAANGGAGYEC